MSKELEYDWNESKIIDDVDFQDEDAKLFQQLLSNKENTGEDGTISSMEVGQILKGTIVELTPDFIVVDVGLKSEGLIPISEFNEPEELQLGNPVEVYLDRTEGEDGQIVLSREKARRQRQWEYILEHCKEGSVIKGKVIRKVKGGLMVDIGMEAFLPGSQIENRRIKNLDDYLENTYDFKILKINIERKNIVVSRRELLEEERSVKKAELLESIQEGQIRKGIVKNITDFGVFLDLDGIDGLLHITDMTWKRIKHPSEIINIGDEIEAKVLKFDRDRNRVSLGLKQLGEDPWVAIGDRYAVNTKTKAVITNLTDYGCFAEIEDGIEGLVHVSEMDWTNRNVHPSKLVQVGDEVDVMILSIDEDRRRISLGIK